MRKSLADAIVIPFLCPMCEYTGGEEDCVRKHMREKHTDEEAIELTGWDLKKYEPDVTKIRVGLMGKPSVELVIKKEWPAIWLSDVKKALGDPDARILGWAILEG